ncbi:hypothetical protein FE374_04105 [Georgenia yuyongxinii]|uniref:Uncharacterized protein n=1 Tax=Georgenia yuyongxinii TaxID=2589797 RepID=A0A5B8C3R4_9MICO|nr:hypothetical protein [Georgenia yuyongxinii]QDC23925.1 hypothetical protein FE374_04105 [Georgenia yuyongxinii]
MIQSVSVRTAARVANRAKRHALARMPLVKHLAEMQHQRRLARYRPALPVLPAHHSGVVRTLRELAVATMAVDDLVLPGTPELKTVLEHHVRALAERPVRGSATIRPDTAQLLEDPALWRWGLSEPMLDLVENYLGMPARYYGADVRREVADGRAHDVRQWHRDIEDRTSLKILIWLNDVDEDGGPFAYVPVEGSARAVEELRYVAGFVTDEDMRRVVPETEWRTCPGPRWTTILADNCRLLHRATPPRIRDRYSVTFTWTTRHPVKTMPQNADLAEQVRKLTTGLTRRQFECLPTPIQRQARELAVTCGG